MNQTLGLVTFIVREYDEAIKFFVNCLNFTVLEDTVLTAEKRWVTVAPSVDTSSASSGAALLLARAVTPEQVACIGNQAGGRVFLFLQTELFDVAYERMRLCGVRFTEFPRNEVYGRVAVFLDLYGNKWDLLERKVSTT